MQVIPAINVTNFDDVQLRLRTARDVGAEWAHIDVADGTFTENALWQNAKQLQASGWGSQINIEVHLMVSNPDEVIGKWLATGVKRVIVHVEAAQNIEALRKQCEEVGVEFVLALNPDTPVEYCLAHMHTIRHILVLAVTPGKAGQVFRDDQVPKIKFLRDKVSQIGAHVTIEVDGGVNAKNAAAIKLAGADIIVSASYIFGSNDPKKAYKTLSEL
ncbi:MAG: hypothetical protein Q8R26_01615 [bacterium]|nr:hypothetical protein [bacterium]